MSALPYSDAELRGIKAAHAEGIGEVSSLDWVRTAEPRWLATLDATRAQLDAATKERDLWRVRTEKCGVAELGVFNPNVASYCREWEARTEKAEAERDALLAERDAANRRGAEAVKFIESVAYAEGRGEIDGSWDNPGDAREARAVLAHLTPSGKGAM